MANFSARSRREGVRSLLAATLASVSTLALTSPASAQALGENSRQAAAERTYDIPAQPLASALMRFAEQADLQVLFAEDDLAGLQSRPLQGRFTPDVALARLLPPGAPSIEIREGRLVRLDSPRPQYAESGSDIDGDIVVTGTRIRGAPPAGANVLTMDREEIDATGRATVQDVVQTLAQNFPGSQNEFTQIASADHRRNLGFGSTVDLRGLGADATLTLLNGRRLAPAGFGNFVDISAIPLAAVERIEVLADGASATYGADAVGGVVNVILRTDYDGAEASLRYGGATQGGMEDFGASYLMGMDWSTGEAMIAFDHRDRKGLAAADREITADSDLTRFGGSNFSRTQSNPGNIIRIGDTPVVLAIPEGQDGTSLSEADLLPGVVNYQNNNEGSWLLPDQESRSVFAAVRQSVSPNVEFFADALVAERRAYAERFQLSTTLVVPESNAWRQLNNLFPGQGPLQISYYLGDDLGPAEYRTETETVSGQFGGAYDFDSGWRFESGVAYGSVNELSSLGHLFDSTAGLNALLASSDLETAFNPFADGSNTNAALLKGLVYDSVGDSFSEIIVASAKADGPLFRLWGGEARAAFGIERRDERFRIARHEHRAVGIITQATQDPGHRVTDALFAELYVPVIGADLGLPLIRDLDLSLSVRRESPDDFSESTTPKVGVNWALSEDFRIRASWGESFKAPQFQQMLGGTGATLLVIPPSFDPFATNGSTGGLFLAGSNRDLEPEEAETWTAGFAYEPSSLRGLSLSATYFDIDFSNRISDAGDILTALKDPAGFEAVLIRNPTEEQIAFYLALAPRVTGTLPPDGIELIWDSRLRNLASLRVRGVDIDLRYDWESQVGQLSVFASASGLFEYTRQNNATAKPIDVLNTMGNPVDWRGRVGLAWRREGWGASLTANYVDSYHDRVSTPPREIDSWTTWDLQLSHRLALPGDERRTLDLALNVQNLADEDPPFANNSFGYAYDSANASPVGRFIGVSVRQAF